MSNAGKAHRLDALREWVASRHALTAEQLNIELAAGDASFRRYFRLWMADGSSRMLMDAPPAKEDSQPFVTVAEAWRSAGLPVPTIHAMDLEAGFIELQDLGDTPLQHCLGGCEDEGSLAWHERALLLIDRLQNQAPGDELPVYDEALLGRELDLFPDWCLSRFLNIETPPGWQEVRHQLIEAALSQPTVAVHRDFDAMNLMVHDEELWLIDFQDAVRGPLTYDPISILRGRYCRFSRVRFEQWIETLRQRAIADGRLQSDTDSTTFLHMADAMAAQRSLKVLGIFCRLTFRDGKSGYLARLPHFLNHLRDSLAPWPAYRQMLDWLDNEFSPTLSQALAHHGISGDRA